MALLQVSCSFFNGVILIVLHLSVSPIPFLKHKMDCENYTHTYCQWNLISKQFMTPHNFLLSSQARLCFPVLPHFMSIFSDAHSVYQHSLSFTSPPFLCWIIQPKVTGQGQPNGYGAAVQSRLTETEWRRRMPKVRREVVWHWYWNLWMVKKTST